MLQLLLERGQSYADIGSLLGLQVDEVRARARGALTEMAGEDPDRDVALTDYLLGQADPIGRADAARHLQTDPEANALAQKLLTQLRLLAPGAELPSLPGAKGPAPAAAPAAKETAPRPKGAAESAGGLSSPQRRLIAALLGGGVIVVLIVLLATGAFSGDDGDGGDGDGGTAAAANRPADNGQGGGGTLTRAVLLPADGGEGRGVAIFGRVRNVPVLEVRAVNLPPSSKGENYSVWLFRDERVSLRVGGVRVDQSGRILTQIPVQPQALELVANGTFNSIVVTLTDDSEFAAEVEDARKAKRLPRLTGDIALRGEISGPAVQQGSGGNGGSGGGGSGGGQGGGGQGG
jgi:hypothetical protein